MFKILVRNFGKLKSGKTVFNFSLISSKNMFTTEACSQRFLLQQQYQQFQKIEDSELNAKTNINFITKEDNQVILNSLESNITAIELKGRNSKHPKTANHGARPCSSVMRRLKKRGLYRKVHVK